MRNVALKMLLQRRTKAQQETNKQLSQIIAFILNSDVHIHGFVYLTKPRKINFSGKLQKALEQVLLFQDKSLILAKLYDIFTKNCIETYLKTN